MATASMPMYEIPETQSAMAALWAAIVRALEDRGVRDAPATLTFGGSVHRYWDDPDLYFSQCCGYDVVRRYKDKLCPVIAPHYDAPLCTGANYVSLIVVRSDSSFSDVMDAAGKVAAINGPESHSGMNALRDLVSRGYAGKSFFADVRISGTHADSLAMVRDRKADIAAIDSVTFALLSRYEPDKVADIRILGSSYSALAPPFVLPAQPDSTLVDIVQDAVLSVLADEEMAAVRSALLITGASPVKVADYAAIAVVEDQAASRGYPVLA